MEISIVIPAYNEKENVNLLIQQFEKSDSPYLKEVLVVDAADSEDLLEDAPCFSFSKAHVIRSKATQRSLQLNEGAGCASGDVLYFVHADVRPPASCLEDIATSLLKGNDFGLFSYQFDSNSALLKINAYCTRFNGIFTGGGDQTFFIWKSRFEEAGGFSNQLEIMEDFELFWRLQRLGWDFEIIPHHVLVSARKYQDNSYLKVNIVNLITVLLFKMGYNQRKLKRFYKSALNTR